MTSNNLEKEIISKVMSNVAKKGHKSNPRPKEFYINMCKKSGESRRKKKELAVSSKV